MVRMSHQFFYPVHPNILLFLSSMRYYPWRLCGHDYADSFNLLGNALRDALDPRLRR